MKFMKVSLFLVVALLVGCASPYVSMRDANRSALNRVDIGMSRAQVTQIMGNVSATGLSGKIENPYRRETARGRDGIVYEILYYYTEQIGDNPVETGLTPVVFADGKVSGIGWGYLDSVVGNSTTTIRRR